MKLALLSKTYAVYRLPCEAAAPPSSLFEAEHGNDFYSITKTKDEVSIVCSQDIDFPHGAAKVEKDWAIFKAEGSLDFGSPGILAALALPLAQAEISIFAVSTFDTHYILVKQAKVEQAKLAWSSAGNSITDEALSQPQPQATNFQADPLVRHLVKSCNANNVPSLFVTLVAGWPTDMAQFKVPYAQVRQAVEACWDASDLIGTSGAEGATTTPPPVYLYPAETLHVTVATFFTTASESYPNEPELGVKIDAWKQVIHKAIQMDDWPTKPLQLRIDSCQIGDRAGIFLWKETTGGMEAMRRCIQVVTLELKSQGWFQDFPGVSPDSLRIPGIIHSTFLRFYSLPTTPARTVQERFREKVIANLSEFFPDPIIIDVSKLVVERTPYMHIPHDDRHVYATSFFSEQKDDQFILDVKSAEDRLIAYRKDSNAQDRLQ